MQNARKPELRVVQLNSCPITSPEVIQITESWYRINYKSRVYYGQTEAEVKGKYYGDRRRSIEQSEKLANTIVDKLLDSDSDLFQLFDRDLDISAPAYQVEKKNSSTAETVFLFAATVISAALIFFASLALASKAEASDLKWFDEIEYYHGPGCPEQFLERFDYLANMVSAWSIGFNYAGETDSLGEDGLTSITCSNNREDIFLLRSLRSGDSDSDLEDIASDYTIYGTTRWHFWKSKQEIFEADIWINIETLDSVSWDNLILHELGHLLGEPHRIGDKSSVMDPRSDIEEYSAEDISRLVDRYNRCGPAYLSRSGVMFIPRVYYAGSYGSVLARLDGDTLQILEILGDPCRVGV